MHKSIKLESPCEFINVTPINPLISKCQIKVCYVGDSPNRNRSVITKDVAKDMANSLPGCPIVGFFNSDKGDFEEHNRMIDISNGKFEIKDTTRPYGFVDLSAKVWFQKFIDDDTVEREYLVTEGYLWTGQYKEAQRILSSGNNQSMELDEKTIDAQWTKDSNGKPQFFIINEAIISKLCILGEEVEPCFEGSTITKVQFSFEDGFKEQLFSMMQQLKEILNEGGAQVFTKYAVEIGDALWSALYSYIDKTYPDSENCYCSLYRIEGVYEEGTQKFAVLQSRKDMKYYRLNFSLSEADGFVSTDGLTEVTKSYVLSAEPQFAKADVDSFEQTYAEKKKEEDEKTKKTSGEDDKTKTGKTEDNTEGEDEKKKKKEFAKEDTCSECGKAVTECACKKKKEYNLEEIPEYVELNTQYKALLEEKATWEAKMQPLVEFKQKAELKDKQAMIETFYMLSDEDKKDVVANIGTYSLEDIEAKLAIICVRNKVSFDQENKKDPANPTVFNLNSGDFSDSTVPAWVKAAESVANKNK